MPSEPNSPSKRLDQTKVSWFAAISVGVFVALLLAMSILKPATTSVFRALVSSITGLHRNAEVRVLDRTEAILAGQTLPSSCDLAVSLTNSQSGSAAVLAMDSDHHLFLPFAALAALCAATPGRILRRLLLFVASLALLIGFLWLSIWVLFAVTLSTPPVSAGNWPGWAVKVGETFLRAWMDPPASRYVIPLLIWLIVAFRVRDWITVKVSAD